MRVTFPRSPRPASLGTFLGTLAFALVSSLAGPAGALPSVDSVRTRPYVAAAVPSPTGDRVAYVLRLDRASARAADRSSASLRLGFLDTATLERSDRARVSEASRLEWSIDGSGFVFQSGDTVAWQAVDEARPTAVLRLDTGGEREFWGADPVVPRCFLVFEIAPDDGGAVRHRLRRIAVDADPSRASDSDAGEILLESPVAFTAVAFAADGRPAVVQQPDVDQDAIDPADRDVVTLRSLEAAGGWGEMLAQCTFRSACGLASARVHRGRVYLRTREPADGAGLWRLESLDLATGERQVMYRDPSGVADLSRVLFDPHSGAPVVAVHHSEALRIEGLSEARAAELDRLRARLFPVAFRAEYRAHRDGEDGLWWVQTDDLHPRFALYRPSVAQVGAPARASGPASAPEWVEVLADPEPTEWPQVERRAITYRATDGLELHGFLTLPPALDAVALAAAPLVVEVHGGPWARRRGGPDRLATFLAARGAVVFEPNFRGSNGYGWRYESAGREEFGDGRVRRDILEGIDHVLGRGFGDSAKVAIVGHSYGGYAVLQALAETPERFRFGVASAPPIDLLRTLDQLERRLGTRRARRSGGLPLDSVFHALLGPIDDPEFVSRLHQESPAARWLARDEAAWTQGEPALVLLAGAQDAKVAVAEVRHLAAELQARGSDVSLVVDEVAGHRFETPCFGALQLRLLELLLADLTGDPSRVGPEPACFADALAERLEIEGESLRRVLRGDRTGPGAPTSH